MDIKTKFSVGDKVRVLADPIIKTTCPFCKGKKSVEIDGETLYCQNCDDGVFINRMSNQRQLVEGVVTGIKLDVKTIDSEDDEWWYEGSEGELGVREEYCVSVSEGYWSDGTYEAKEVMPMEGDSNE